MIPGINVDAATEARIWAAFAGWADHFRSALQSGGVPWLLKEYRTLVDSIETQSCGHGDQGARRVGAAWQQCCGFSYEYYNDVAVRDAIEKLVSVLPVDASADLAGEVAAIDQRLRRLFPEVAPAGQHWWRSGLPKGVVE